MLRVISGSARNLKLITPEGLETRPTTDRIKETLFNMLESWRLKEGKGWGQLSFLDVFAGSGSIGIEAWSRGVKLLYFMENDAEALKVLNQNLALVKLPQVAAVDALNPPPAPRAISLVFMDAPYGKELWAAVLPKLVDAGWIDKDTLVVVETDKKAPEIVPEGFYEVKERAAGRNLFLFIKQGVKDETELYKNGNSGQSVGGRYGGASEIGPPWCPPWYGGYCHSFVCKIFKV